MILRCRQKCKRKHVVPPDTSSNCRHKSVIYRASFIFWGGVGTGVHSKRLGIMPGRHLPGMQSHGGLWICQLAGQRAP